MGAGKVEPHFTNGKTEVLRGERLAQGSLAFQTTCLAARPALIAPRGQLLSEMVTVTRVTCLQEEKVVIQGVVKGQECASQLSHHQT